MLAPVEETWCQYLDASTQVVYPVKPGDIRVALINTSRVSLFQYEYSMLVEGWFTPKTSEHDAIALHDKVTKADSLKGIGAYLRGLKADPPQPLDDPDSDLDRYQFTVTFTARNL